MGSHIRSHVSKKSVAILKEVIGAVKPDCVVLELCKDRTDLLVPPGINPGSPSQRWHLREVRLSGLAPGLEGFPSASELLRATGVSAGVPHTRAEMEAGAVALLATGLFGACKISCSQAPPEAAPLYRPAGQQVETVLPLGTLEYQVVPRVLPAIQSLQVAVEGVRPEQREQFARAAMDKARSSSPLLALMSLRQQLQGILGDRAPIVFTGAETGNVVASMAPQNIAPLTGLEPSAIAGKGAGIDNPYRVPPALPAAPGAAVVPQPAAAGQLSLRRWGPEDFAHTSSSSAGTSSGGACMIPLPHAWPVPAVLLARSPLYPKQACPTRSLPPSPGPTPRARRRRESSAGCSLGSHGGRHYRRRQRQEPGLWCSGTDPRAPRVSAWRLRSLVRSQAGHWWGLRCWRVPWAQTWRT